MQTIFSFISKGIYYEIPILVYNVIADDEEFSGGHNINTSIIKYIRMRHSRYRYALMGQCVVIEPKLWTPPFKWVMVPVQHYVSLQEAETSIEERYEEKKQWRKKRKENKNAYSD